MSDVAAVERDAKVETPGRSDGADTQRGRLGQLPTSRAASMLALQRGAGNAAVSRRLAGAGPGLGQPVVAREVKEKPPAGAETPAPAATAQVPSPPPPPPPAATSTPPGGPPVPLTKPAGKASVAAAPSPGVPATAKPPAVDGNLPTGTPSDSGSLDWDNLFAAVSDKKNTIRTVLETVRAGGNLGGGTNPLVMPITLIVGLAADGMSMYSDITSLPGGAGDDPVTDVMVGARDVIQIFNNMLGTAASATQTVQDGATATVVGAPIDAVTLPMNNGIEQAKVGLDSAQLLMDILINVQARMNRNNSADPANAKAWDAVVANYDVSIAGDVVNTLLDVGAMVSAGASNSEVMKSIAQLYRALKDPAKLAISWLLAQVGIFGGSAAADVSPMSPAPGATPAATGGSPVQKQVLQLLGEGAEDSGVGNMAKRAAAQLVLTELTGAERFYNVAMDMAGTMFNEVQTALAGLESMTKGADGKGALSAVQEQMVKMLDAMHGKVAEMGEVVAMGGTVADKSKALHDGLSHARTSVAGMTIGELHIPHVKDDGLASEAENVAIDLADKGLQLALSAARTMLEGAKAPALAALDGLMAKAGTAAQFGQVMQDVASSALASLNHHIASLASKVAHVHDLTSAMNAGLGELSDLAGMDPPMTVEGLVDDVKQIGVLIEKARGFVQDYLDHPAPKKAKAEKPDGPAATATAPDPPD